jgi:sugar phosphate isomerase/epimerase
MEPSRLSVPALSLSRDLRRALALARELGVRGVEIDGRRGIAAEQITQTGLRQIRKWLDDEGLVVSAVAFPTRGGYAAADRLEARIAATKSALELAHALKAQVVINHIGDIPPPPADGNDEPDPAWQLLIDVLADIGAWGHRVGATLCAEAGRAAPVDLLRVIAALPTGSLLCDVATGTLLVHRHDPVAAVEMLGSHIGFVHVTDAVAGAYAGRGRPAPLGAGEVDVPAVLGALEERAYRGWIGLESADESAGMAELAAAIGFLGGVSGA